MSLIFRCLSGAVLLPVFFSLGCRSFGEPSYATLANRYRMVVLGAEARSVSTSRERHYTAGYAFGSAPGLSGPYGFIQRNLSGIAAYQRPPFTGNSTARYLAFAGINSIGVAAGHLIDGAPGSLTRGIVLDTQTGQQSILGPDTAINGINDSGVLIGEGLQGRRAFVWVPSRHMLYGEAVEIVPGGKVARAYQISNHGAVVGSFQPATEGPFDHRMHAFLKTDVLNDLSFSDVHESSFSLQSHLNGINEAGIAVGSYVPLDDAHTFAMIYKPSIGATPFGHCDLCNADVFFSSARGINAQGTVVGSFAWTQNGVRHPDYRAFVSDVGSENFLDLNELIDEPAQIQNQEWKWLVREATEIDESGRIMALAEKVNRLTLESLAENERVIKQPVVLVPTP